MFGTEINSKVPLEAVFRLQVLVSNLIAEGALMLSAGAEFSKIWGAETTGYIGPQREVFSKRTHRSKAGADAGESADEVLKTAIQGLRVEPADIGP